jgi:hypothetical protein
MTKTTSLFGLIILIIIAFYFTRSPGLGSSDVRLYVRHNVADYAVWKKGYDAFAPMRGDVFYQAVFQSATDPKDVTVIHDFHSLEAAQAFANSPQLKEAMGKIGVVGAPQIWFTKLGAK